LCRFVPAGTPVQLASGKPEHDLEEEDVPGDCVAAAVALDVAEGVGAGAVVATAAVVAVGLVDVDGVVVGVRGGGMGAGRVVDVDGLLDGVDCSIGWGAVVGCAVVGLGAVPRLWKTALEVIFSPLVRTT
jgi:hypothetical protein